MEASKSIDVKVISCKDIKSFNLFQKLSIYCAVSLGDGDSDRSQSQQSHKTPVDRQGDRNPEWNHEIRLNLEEIPTPQRDLIFLHFDLFSEGNLIFADKLLGVVRVPLADLVRDFNGAIRFVSYQIRASDGKPNGVLNFSYNVNGEGKIASYPSVDSTPAEYDVPICHYPTPAPATYYPPPPTTYYPPPPAFVPCYPPPMPVAFPSHPPYRYGHRPGDWSGRRMDQGDSEWFLRHLR